MKKVLILFFILIFPSAIYVYFTAGKEKSFVRLPYYGPKKTLKIIKKGKYVTDTLFYSIPAFRFFSQYSQPFIASSLQHKIWVGCFIHLNDTVLAPAMAVLMDRVESRTDLDTALKLITFTLDSESANVLMAYSGKIHAGKKQYFLSGNADALNGLADNGFYQPVDSGKNNYKDFFLIDKEGCIRGVYNGTSVKDIDRLVDEIGMIETAYYIKNQHEKQIKGGDEDEGI